MAAQTGCVRQAVEQNRFDGLQQIAYILIRIQLYGTLGETGTHGVMGMLDRCRDPRAVPPPLGFATGGEGSFFEPDACFELASISLRNCSLFMMAQTGQSASLPVTEAALMCGEERFHPRRGRTGRFTWPGRTTVSGLQNSPCTASST